MPERAEDSLIGTVVGGRYRVLARLGMGTTGSVYRAHHEGLGRDVALKLVLARYASRPEARARLVRESKAAGRVAHSAIVAVTDHGEADDGRLYLVMEHVAGPSLAEEIARGPFELARALRVARRIASALAAAHDAGVIHRDVKPTNVLLVEGAPDGALDAPKIVDFGLASMLDEQSITRTGQVMGTPAYMSPEQAAGRRVTEAADIYALGCVLYEMLIGTPPFTGAVIEVLQKQLATVAPVPSVARVEIPPDVDVLVARLLAKSPSARPPSARDVAIALAAASAELASETDDAMREVGRLCALAEARYTGAVPPAVAAELAALADAADAFGTLRARLSRTLGRNTRV